MAGLERWRGRRVGILGFARSGEALARALLRAGADPVVWDDGEAARARARALGLPTGEAVDPASLALLVASPGVPLHFPAPHPVIAAARAAGVRVTGDIQLFAESRPDLRLVGVTGSNGKSTTAALTRHLLAAGGEPVLLGGNIGVPVFALEAPAGATVVLELSSYQLDLCDALVTAVGVWLNLSPDHLDRHGSLEGYIAAKRRLFDQQPADAVAVIAVDDEHSRRLARELAAAGRRVVRVSGSDRLDAAVGVTGEAVLDRLAGDERRFPLPGRTGLQGAHNRQNIAAAWATARLLGTDGATLLAALPGFAGLPHRMEEVGRIGRVRFVNDSKATNPDAAAKSLTAYEDVFWIAGGRAKPGGFAALDGALAAVRHAFFIGEAAAEMAASFAGRFPITHCGTLDLAVEHAHAAARDSDALQPVVLLAPACASFDQFRDFEARGDRFRELVRALASRMPAGEPVS